MLRGEGVTQVFKPIFVFVFSFYEPQLWNIYVCMHVGIGMDIVVDRLSFHDSARPLRPS